MSRLDVFVVGRGMSMRHYEDENSLEINVQPDIVHTFAHFAIFCTFWSFPNAPVFVAEVVSSSVRIVTNAGHALREPVFILNIFAIKPGISMTVLLVPTSSYWVQRPIVV